MASPAVSSNFRAPKAAGLMVGDPRKAKIPVGAMIDEIIGLR